MDKSRYAATPAKKTGDLPQSLEMPNSAADNNERMSYMSQKARSMSLYGSQLFQQARSPTYALFCLSETNPIRRLSKLIVEWKVFEYFILLAIAANCIVLALNTPLPEEDRTELSMKLEKAELYFVLIFCIEALLKIMAYGFLLHPGSYLRNVWNILDFVVVVIGIISLPEVRDLYPGTSLDVKALRAVRVLRPLKLISGVPSLQVVMKSIVRAMVPLLQIALLVLFCILIYAIIGLEFLKNQFHSTCYSNETGLIEENPRPCDKGPFKGVRQIFRGRKCDDGFICNEGWVGPNDGITTFDNIAVAMITVFQCITMEGWTSIMYWTFDAMDSDGYLYACYYVSLIVIGSFFVLNLVLGVLSGEFAKERERVDTRRKFFKVRRQQQLERQVHAYQSWIDKAAEIAAEDNGYRTQHLSLNDSQSHLATNDVVSNPGRVVSKREGNTYRVNLPERVSAFQRFCKWKTKTSFKIRAMVKSQAFYWTVLVCVFLNTIVLAVEFYNQPQWLHEFQYYAEIVFLTFFFLEMMLKLFGLGINNYFASSFNCFDCAVVWCGFVDMILEKHANLKLGISVLRCVRLLRVFKVTRHWRSLRNLATSLVSSIKSIVSLIFLLFLFILIAALLGMQIFGGKFIEKNKAPPRTNFDDFQNAMLAVFQILTGEDWNSVMYNGVNALGGPKSWGGIGASLYFILLVILGNYTLLNVFLAIAVDNLANAQILTEDEENEKLERQRKREENKKKYSQKPQKGKGWGKAGAKLPVVMAINHFVRKRNAHASTVADPNNVCMVNGETITISSSLKKKITTYRRAASHYDKEERNGAETSEPAETLGTNDEGDEGKRKMRVRRRRNETNGHAAKDEDKDEDEDDRPISGRNFMKALRTGRFGKRRRAPRRAKPLLKVNTLFLFSPENRFRRLCHRIVNLRHFDNFMLVIIMLSSITIAIEDPVSDDSPRNKVLMYFDYVFTAIFALEVIVKIIDVGVILHKGAYFRDWWNVIDALVVTFNLASLVLERTQRSGDGRSVIKALRVFRVLRPFKGIHKIKKLQAVFRCMWYSVKNVANILMITMLFLFIFAVMGVQLFNGKFQECNDGSKLTKDTCQGQYFIFAYDEKYQKEVVVKVNNRTWETKKLNFDNVFAAMLTLYTSSTGEGWPSAMQSTMDTTEEDMGPIVNNSPGYAIYYISFVVVFSFFFLNIFVALIILTFQEEGEREIASCELDRNQRDCIQFALTSKPAQRYMPRNVKSVQYKIWTLVTSKPFDTFILCLIALNTVVLMTQHHGEPTDFKEILMYLNIFFTVLYMIEAGLKFIALRFNYFKDYWNLFDFIVVLGGLLDVIVTIIDEVYDSQDENPLGIGIDPSMFRLFRAARLIKLLRRGYTIRILLWTFLQSFKALPYVTLLIMLMFFMYAVIGMQLFGKIALDRNTEINENNNFRNLLEALQVLFRSATGEDWHKIMLSCYSNAKCDPAAHDDYGPTCGSTVGAVIFFCSFIFLCMFLMLNLFVAVIMDNFEYLTRDESILGPHHLDEFVRVWSEFDPGASGSVHHSEIYRVMCSMSPPVGFGKKCPKIVGYKRLIKMNMPLNEDNTVSFSTTLFALIRTSLNIKLRGNMNANDTELRKMIKNIWPKTSEKVLNKLIPKQSVLSCQQMTIGKIYCAKLIHENYKYLKRKGMPTERTERSYERSTNHSKGGLFSKLVGSLRRNRRNTDDIELGNVERLRDRSYTTDARLNLARNIPRRPNSESEDDAPFRKRRSSWGPSPKLNGDVKKNGRQPYPDPSRAVMEVPCSVAVPSVAENFREQSVLPSTYLTPTRRRSDKVSRLKEGASLDLDSSSDSDTGVDVDQDRSDLRRDPYYDNMITRINSQLAAAVARGTSPYVIYGMEDDDADDWC